MAGLPNQVGDLDRVFGGAVVDLANALAEVNALNDMIDDTARIGGQAGLITKGYDSPGALLIVNAFGDLAALYRVAHAQQAQPGANDFFFNAKLLMGTTPLT